MINNNYRLNFQEWYVNLNKLNDNKDDVSTTKIEEINNSSRSDAEDFVTASDCTGTPPSRSSSSYHTPSEGETISHSPWWEIETALDVETMENLKCQTVDESHQQVFYDLCKIKYGNH